MKAMLRGKSIELSAHVRKMEKAHIMPENSRKKWSRLSQKERTGNNQTEDWHQQNRNTKPNKESMKQRYGSLRKINDWQTLIQTNQKAEKEYPNKQN